jgi:hypothetical protein
MTVLARVTELLWQSLAFEKISGEVTHATNNTLARFPSSDRGLRVDCDAYKSL